jgi:cytidyltransferase-like protein
MAIGIICEFNPFHNGHKYLIQKAKSLVNEPVAVVMSTSFTQRGEIAITDKFTRAKSALLGGADLVIELPVAYAVSNAEVFAKSGVKILSSFSDMNYLAFGSFVIFICIAVTFLTAILFKIGYFFCTIITFFQVFRTFHLYYKLF